VADPQLIPATQAEASIIAAGKAPALVDTHLIPTIHPAALLRGGKPVADVIRMDMAKALRVSQEGPKQIENIVVAHPASPAGVEGSVRIALSWLDKWLINHNTVAIDVETSSINYFSCKLYSIALAGIDGHNAAVAWTLGNLHTLPWDAERALNDKLYEILASPNCTTLYHNAPFDYAVLVRKGYKIGGPIEDTQSLHHLVQPDIPHTLDWIVHTYCDVEPWKLDHQGKKQAFTKDVIELLVYNAKDALNTAKIRQPLLDEIAIRQMNQELIDYQMSASRLAAEMEIAGVPVDWGIRRKMGDQRRRELLQLLTWLRKYLNWDDFNPMSKKHAVEALYSPKYVGLTPQAWTAKTRQPSTKYEDIIAHMEHDFVWRFVRYVEMHHAWATMFRDADPFGKTPAARRGGAFWQARQEDGRIHAKWNPTGQKGSRWSSSPNLQNVPPKDRRFFRAGEGRVIVGADLDQLELRLAAVLAGVPELLTEMHKPDGDPHTLAARNVYPDFDSKSATERKQLRDAVKNVVYASLYRAGVKTVHKTIRKKKFLPAALRAALTLNRVNHIYQSYFGKYVELPMYHDRNYDLAQTQGYIEIPPFGRRRYFPVQPPPYTECANWPVQTCGSDCVMKCMVHIQDELKRFPDAWQILHGHDAVYVECYERHAEEILDIVNRLFGTTVIDGPAGPVTLTAAGKIGKDLYEVK
jgi:DNA polymerase I